MPKPYLVLIRSLLLAALALLLSSHLVGAHPVEIARGTAPKHPQQPQLAVDAKGVIHLVFGVGDTVRYLRSEEGGKFTRPIDLPAVHNMSLGMRRGPRIAVTEGSNCVTAIGGRQGKGRDGDVLAMCSADDGHTWSESVRVNDVADSAREGLHAMAAGPGGEMCCVWLDLRNRKTQVMSSLSSDGGRTWSPNLLVYRSPSGSVCECCHPSVAIGDAGLIHVLFRNSLDGKRDMYVASSLRGGKSFRPAVKLGPGSWPLDACPMDGGAIAVTKGGKLHTAWQRDKTVFLASNAADEHSLGGGEQPWIAATNDRSYAVWLKKRGEALHLHTPGSSETHILSSHAKDPVIAAGPSGGGPVVAAWEARDGTEHTIEAQVVSP